MNIQDILAVCEGNMMVSYSIYDDNSHVVKPKIKTAKLMNNTDFVSIEYNLENVKFLSHLPIDQITNQLTLIGGDARYNIDMVNKSLNFRFIPNL